MKKQIILIITIIVLFLGFLIGCEKENNGKTIDLSKIELVNWTIETHLDMVGNEYKQITGYVSNNAGKSFKQIKIETEFFDSDNNSIKIKDAYVNDIANKETKEFTVIYHSANDYYYQVDWNNIKFKIIIEDIE